MYSHISVYQQHNLASILTHLCNADLIYVQLCAHVINRGHNNRETSECWVVSTLMASFIFPPAIPFPALSSLSINSSFMSGGRVNKEKHSHHSEAISQYWNSVYPYMYAPFGRQITADSITTPVKLQLVVYTLILGMPMSRRLFSDQLTMNLESSWIVHSTSPIKQDIPSWSIYRYVTHLCILSMP